MKGYEGQIIADFRYDRMWVTNGDSVRSPVSQANHHRFVLTNYLLLNFIKSIAYPWWVKNDDSSKADYIKFNIDSWIVTEEGSSLEYRNYFPKKYPYLKALPL